MSPMTLFSSFIVNMYWFFSALYNIPYKAFEAVNQLHLLLAKFSFIEVFRTVSVNFM